MKTEDARWSKLRDLFGKAIDLPPDARDAVINAGCGDDNELKKELQTLLKADHGHATGPLTGAVGAAIHATSSDRRQKMIGTVIGSYRLVSILGHGGAGTVYLAERADRQYSAQVAVKVVESAALHADSGRRFRAERQILASLNHTNIARLLDAGETPSGHPYLVMEYVHGEPVDSYCDARRLGVAARLQLFLKICGAVHYAHQNLIVHRDLKPANILVTADGTPKLLDFGIAKLLDSSQATLAMALTRVNDRVLTPEYASPEQILGRPVTTASDVYALGVVLYELLTGLRPYQVSTASQLELERSICVTDPARPSAVLARALDDPKDEEKRLLAAPSRGLTPARLRQQLLGDLDAIVMRALRKEPEHRYGSIEQLADDVRRYLNQEPVTARQGNWLYYSQRFARRHAFGVSAATTAIIFLAAVAIFTSLQAKRIAAERDRAAQERERAEAVSTFMLDVFAAGDPYVTQGREVTARELLDQAGRRIASNLDQQPEVRARLLETIGRAYERQGQSARAAAFIEDALRLRRKFESTDSTSFAGTLVNLGVSLRQSGNFADAEKSFDEARRILEQRGEDSSPAYASLLADLGRLEHQRGDIDSAEQYFNRSLALTRQLFGSSHPEVAAVLADLTTVKQWKADLPEAERLAREVVQIYRTTVDELHPDRVTADYWLGETLLAQGKADDASPLIERALAAQRLIYGDVSPRVAATLDTLSMVRQQQNRLSDAEKLAREALDVSERSQGTRNFNAGYYRTALSVVLFKRGRLKEAEQEARSALEILNAALTEDHQYIASAEYQLGEILLASHKTADAAALLAGNISRWERAGAPPWRAARSESALGEALFSLGRAQEAERHLLSAYRSLATAGGGASADAARTAHQRLVRFYTARGESDKLAALPTNKPVR